MIEAPIPPDETDRLSALQATSLLDSPAEARFDRITRTACRLFSVPIALVSLVDGDRQWFKSHAGLTASHMPRGFSFCGHAILSNDVLVVPDATADARFADNPLVTGEQHFRFYAGVPLASADGHRLGTLCLIDRVPRRFTDHDMAALRDLGAWAEQEMNLKTTLAANALAQQQKAQLRAIVDHAGDGIITIDQHGIIETFNPAAARMFDYLPQQMIGEDFRRLTTPEYHAAAGQFLAKFSDDTMRPDSRINLDFIGRREDGSTFAAELVVSQMRLREGHGFTAIVRDMTEKKRVEQMKNAFIANVSHELRTPLTSIRGSLGLLASGALGALPASAQSLLDIASSNCERLVRLVGDILDIEKIESGNMGYRMQRQALLPLVAQAIAATRDYAAGFDVRLQLADDAQDGMVDADADRLVQVLVNLLSNAAKYSPAGDTVGIDLRTGAGSVRLSVVDHGNGIPSAFRHRIFQKFAQADDSDSRRKGGTGLGLAISRTIVERHGGRIGFSSEPGHTEFFVELPPARSVA